jgi:hypothetical protein
MGLEAHKHLFGILFADLRHISVLSLGIRLIECERCAKLPFSVPDLT